MLMIATMDPLAAPPAQPASEPELSATLRAVTYQSRAMVVPLLAEALEDCGCWPRSRSGGVSYLCLRLELPLRAVADLYPSLIECGLELDRSGHRDLAMLCTLHRHAQAPEVLLRTLHLRLDVSFADEMEPMTVGTGAALA